MACFISVGMLPMTCRREWPIKPGKSVQNLTSLADVGSDKTKILAARIYLSDMSQKEEMNRAWLEWIPEDDLPSRATIGVASLGDPNRLIEVIITAAR
jgi:enamine deaminase RidA (YjgF/YER057c/UK114 family)